MPGEFFPTLLILWVWECNDCLYKMWPLAFGSWKV